MVSASAPDEVRVTVCAGAATSVGVLANTTLLALMVSAGADAHAKRGKPIKKQQARIAGSEALRPRFSWIPLRFR